MNRATIVALNRINLKFYRRQAAEFSRTRARPWPGWRRLEPILSRRWPRRRPLAVLDAGCGNAIFARFLEDRLRRPFSYLGIDASPELVQEARRSLGKRARPAGARSRAAAKRRPRTGRGSWTWRRQARAPRCRGAASTWSSLWVYCITFPGARPGPDCCADSAPASGRAGS
jgi:SAM-dependent methyltransferase